MGTRHTKGMIGNILKQICENIQHLQELQKKHKKCQMINETTHKKVQKICILTTTIEEICSYSNKLSSWHNFILTQTVTVICL